MNILVLNSNPKCLATRNIVEAGKKRGHKMVILDPAYFSPLVSSVERGFDRIYDLLPTTVSRIYIQDIDAIIPRIGNNVIYNSYVLEQLTLNMGIYSVISAIGLRIAASKWHTLQTVSRHGIKVPLTIYSRSSNNVEFLIEKIGSVPFVLKYNYGSQGLGVALMTSKKSAISTIEALLKNKADFLLQQYIESKGQDIRAVVVGNQVIASYKRTAPRGDFRSNISGGGSGESINLSVEDQIIAIKASQALGLEFSGCDLIKDSKGTTYLTEVNSNPGFAGQKVTGINFAEPLIRYIENRELSGKTAPAKTPNQFYDQLKEENRKLWGHVKFFTENRRIQQIFENTKDKDISYRDISGKWMMRRIKNIYDIYRIVFDTLMIK